MREVISMGEGHDWCHGCEHREWLREPTYIMCWAFDKLVNDYEMEQECGYFEKEVNQK